MSALALVASAIVLMTFAFRLRKHLDQDSLNKLQALIEKKASGGTTAAMLAPLDAQKHEVVFAIVTHKDKKQKSKNLPLCPC